MTTPGQAVTGTAAALIFGTVDDLGRGEKWIKTGTTKSLGARLGDCSSVNKTLTIAGQTCTFTTNLTAASNTAVLAIINAALTTAPVSQIDIQTESFPDTGYTRRVRNSTGATIPKGRFVKFTGAKTIALSQPGDPIDGWTYREILNGAIGEIIKTKKIADTYIGGSYVSGAWTGGAAAGTGLWGLAADGLLDFAAATKRGTVQGNIVTVGLDG